MKKTHTHNYILCYGRKWKTTLHVHLCSKTVNTGIKTVKKIIYKTIDDYVYNIIYLLCHRDVLRFLWHFVRNAGSTKNNSPANKATPPDTRNDTVQSPVTSLIHPGSGCEMPTGTERQRFKSPWACGRFSRGTISSNKRGMNIKKEPGNSPCVIE